MVIPGTPALDQADLKLRDLPASASLLGLKACTALPGYQLSFNAITILLENMYASLHFKHKILFHTKKS